MCFLNAKFLKSQLHDWRNFAFSTLAAAEPGRAHEFGDELHGRSTMERAASRSVARGHGRDVGGAVGADIAGWRRGKNDAAASRLSGQAERHLQLRDVHAVRAAGVLQGGVRRHQRRRLVQGLRARGLTRREPRRARAVFTLRIQAALVSPNGHIGIRP